MRLKRRFWERVKEGPGCWDWTGAASTNGYGKVWVRGKRMGTHRVAWELTYGPIPKGLIVCHRCDRPICVRPDHLFVGTHRDNSDDKYRKDRAVASTGQPLKRKVQAPPDPWLNALRQAEAKSRRSP